ncbi:MAG: hypothetical protein WCP97_07975 [bacterium]
MSIIILIIALYFAYSLVKRFREIKKNNPKEEKIAFALVVIFFLTFICFFFIVQDIIVAIIGISALLSSITISHIHNKNNQQTEPNEQNT